MSLFGCPTRRAKHAKGARDPDWMDTTFRQQDRSTSSRHSVSGQQVASTVCVLQTYKAQLSNELSVTKGEMVHLVHHARHWAFVVNSNGAKGYIPYAFCSDPSSNVASRPQDDATSSQQSERARQQNGSRGQLSGEVTRTAREQHPVVDAVSERNDDYDDHDDDIDNESESSGASEPLDFADTISLRSSLEPEMGKRMAAGINMADVLPFFKVPYGKSAVLFDFEAHEENDVSVSRGQTVIILNQDDPSWVWVRTSDLREGFVPRMFICPCGCTSIHEQIVESLQVNMFRAQEKQQQRVLETKTNEQKSTIGGETRLNPHGSSSLPSHYRSASAGAAVEMNRKAANSNALAQQVMQKLQTFPERRAVSVTSPERTVTSPGRGMTLPGLGVTSPGRNGDDKSNANGHQIQNGAAFSGGGERLSTAGPAGDFRREQIKMVIRTDYLAKGRDELSVRRGTWVMVSEKSLQHAEQTEWLYVYCPQTSSSGYIPKSCAMVMT